MANLSQKFQVALNNPENLTGILLHKIGSKFSYNFLKDYALPPETVNIYPTFRCNLRCEMCFEKFAKVKEELSPGDWIRVIKEIKRFYPRIHLSGGEPFIFKDILKIIECIKNNKLYLHITTNGTFLEEYAEEIIRFRVNRIDISIDGPENSHDRIRGVKGAFNKILKGLGRLKSLKESGLPIIKINSIINLRTPETMKEIIKIAQEFDVSMVQFIYPLYLEKDAIMRHKRFLKESLGRDINYWSQADNYKPEPGDFSNIQSVLKNSLMNKIIVDIFPKFKTEQFEAYYKNQEIFNKVYPGRCRAMWNTLTILPDGSIESCPDYVVGNIKTQKVLNAWNNQAMAKLRNIIKDKKFFSVCRACCFFYQ